MGDPSILNQPRLPIAYDEPSRLVNPFLERFGRFEDEYFQLIDIFDKNLTFAVYNLMKFKGGPLELAPFQSVILQTLWDKTFPIFLATRGGGKTFLLAIYALLRAVLVPGSKIVIIAASFRQAKLVFDYALQIYEQSPLINQAVTKILRQNDRHHMTIGNGLSTINALPLGNGEKIRGERACVSPDTLIDTKDGLIEAREVVESNKDYFIYNSNGFEVPSNYCRTNITNIHRVETTYGIRIEFSDIHRIYTDKGWKDINELTTDDRVVLHSSKYFPTNYVQSKLDKKFSYNEARSDYKLPNSVTEGVGKILGHLVSEGTVSNKNGSISFTNTDLDMIDDFCDTFESVFGVRPAVYKKDAYTDDRGWKCKVSYSATINRIGIRRYLDSVGLGYNTARHKLIPWSILRSPRTVVVEFLKSLFEGDGTAVIYKDKRRDSEEFYISYYSASRRLCEQLQTLMLKFGLVGSLSKRAKGNLNYYLRFNKSYSTSFAKDIGFLSSRKNSICQYALDNFKPKCYSGNSIKIKRIDKNIRKGILYDLCMPRTHRFVGNGILNHNTDILCDEYASVPEEIFQVVVRGFAAVSSDPVAAAKQIHLEDELIREGVLKEEDRTKRKSNKIIYSGTASYQFNHYFKLWKIHKAIIDSKFIGDARQINTAFDLNEDEGFILDGYLDYRDYAIVQLPYTGLPRGFMDDKQINQAYATMPKALFQMEYECQFPTDSDGFFKRSDIEEATPKPDSGKSFGIELVGDKNYEYVMGIDPARKTDNFAISILKIIPGKGCRNVYCWTFNNKNFIDCTRKIRDLLEKFNVVRIAMDAGGGGLQIEDLLQNVELSKGQPAVWRFDDEEHARFDGIHILDVVNFTSSWIADANYGLAADIEHKRLLFPFKSKDSVANSEEEDVIWDEINTQIEEMCMITVSATKTGVQHFDLPELPTAEKNAINAQQRKDRYSALLLSGYAARSYISEGQKEFMPLPGDWIDYF